MSTYRSDIENALVSKLASYSDAQGVEVEWGNADASFTANSDVYVRETNLMGDTNQAGLGKDGVDVTIGVYQLDIFARAGTSKWESLEIADDLANLYKRGSVLSFNGVDVTLTGVSIKPGGKDGSWFQTIVEVRYRVYTDPR